MNSKKIVVLIHALASCKYFMQPIANYLIKHGFKVYNWDYKSRKFTIDEIAKQLSNYIIEQKIQGHEINFVTHSMGGIVVRYYAKYYNAKIKNVVMIAPPNKGSELVDIFSEFYIYRKIFGPAACSIGTKEDSIPKQLGEVDFNLGVITGNSSLDPFCSYLLKSENDGKVTVENTKLDSMKEHLVIKSCHTLIIFNKSIYNNIYNFLQIESFFNKTN